MTAGGGAGPRVTVVGVHLDPLGRNPDELLRGGWRDFGRAAAAARHAGVPIAMAQAAWADADRVIDGVPCAFVREPGRVRAGWWRRRPRALLRRVAAQNPDVVHFEGLAFPRELRALAAALPGIPILAQDHASKCPRGWRRPWYRWGFAPLAGVAFTSHAQARPFTAAGVLRRDLPVFEVIEVSSPFTPGDRGAARAETGLEGDPCLVWVGNLDANKDPLTVLDAASRAAARLPALRLHMCFRDAPLLDAVRARIAADPALAPRVRLVGPVPHSRIEPFLRAADFLVQASHAEGSGTALIEALACGTTPLVTDIPSFRRITDDGAVGALVRVGDSVALADALCDWSARDRPALRERARRHFERDLSFAAMGAQLRAAYQALWSMRHE